MPGDRLPLAVGVRGQVDLVRALHRLTKVLERLLAIRDLDIGWLEVVVHANTQARLR